MYLVTKLSYSVKNLSQSKSLDVSAPSGTSVAGTSSGVSVVVDAPQADSDVPAADSLEGTSAASDF